MYNRDRTVIANTRDCYIDVIHHESDPGPWIVRRWKKILFFRKRVSSDWFIGRQQAFAYAQDMKKEYSGRLDIDPAKENKHHESL